MMVFALKLEWQEPVISKTTSKISQTRWHGLCNQRAMRCWFGGRPPQPGGRQSKRVAYLMPNLNNFGPDLDNFGPIWLILGPCEHCWQMKLRHHLSHNFIFQTCCLLCWQMKLWYYLFHNFIFQTYCFLCWQTKLWYHFCHNFIFSKCCLVCWQTRLWHRLCFSVFQLAAKH